MTPDETAIVLKLFRSAWPTYEPDTYTPHVWSEATRDVAGDVGLDAARRLVLVLDWPPSIARFREECHTVQLDRLPEHVEHEQPRDEQRGSRWGSISAALRAVQPSIPKHDHHHGWENCPACSTADEREQTVTAALRAGLDIGSIETLPVPAGKIERHPRAGSFYDPDCTCDHGWVTVHANYAAAQVEGGRDLAADAAALQARVDAVEQFGTDDPTLDAELAAYGERRRQVLMWSTAVYPCPDCRKPMYDRWRAGCYRRNHHRKSCKVCGPDAIKKLDADEPRQPAGEKF